MVSYIQKVIYGLIRKTYRKLTGLNANVHIHNWKHIHIGNNVRIASGVAIISHNHDIYNVSKHIEWEDIYIGDNSWLGANSVILPGVKLGPNTIVGAGAIVTKSFPNGFCVIAGNPAKIIKKLEKHKCK